MRARIVCLFYTPELVIANLRFLRIAGNCMTDNKQFWQRIAKLYAPFMKSSDRLYADIRAHGSAVYKTEVPGKSMAPLCYLEAVKNIP